MIKLSEYPTGTYIVYDFDEYVKTERFWKPLDDMSNHLTFREVDHFQERGDKIDIMAIPWAIAEALIETVSDYYADNFGVSTTDDILREAIKEAKK